MEFGAQSVVDKNKSIPTWLMSLNSIMHACDGWPMPPAPGKSQRPLGAPRPLRLPPLEAPEGPPALLPPFGGGDFGLNASIRSVQPVR